MALGRLLLRFLVVPFGFCFATVAAVAFVVIAHWTRFMAIVAANRGGDEDAALFIAGFFIVFFAAVSAAKMLWPMVLAAVLAEVFAFRSWVFHVCGGAVAALIGLNTVSDTGAYDLYNAPVIVVGAGFAAGFVYWLVAGWSAGFWKPVFGPARRQLPQTQSLPGASPPAP